jgi:hypothetical protein
VVGLGDGRRANQRATVTLSPTGGELALRVRCPVPVLVEAGQGVFPRVKAYFNSIARSSGTFDPLLRDV